MSKHWLDSLMDLETDLGIEKKHDLGEPIPQYIGRKPRKKKKKKATKPFQFSKPFAISTDLVKKTKVKKKRVKKFIKVTTKPRKLTKTIVTHTNLPKPRLNLAQIKKAMLANKNNSYTLQDLMKTPKQVYIVGASTKRPVAKKPKAKVVKKYSCTKCLGKFKLETDLTKGVCWMCIQKSEIEIVKPKPKPQPFNMEEFKKQAQLTEKRNAKNTKLY